MARIYTIFLSYYGHFNFANFILTSESEKFLRIDKSDI